MFPECSPQALVMEDLLASVRRHIICSTSESAVLEKISRNKWSPIPAPAQGSIDRNLDETFRNLNETF
jgi:hypothetical protein